MSIHKKRFRLYIDESGDHTFSTFEDPGKRYLGLTGVILDSEYYREVFHGRFEALKQRHFPHNPDEPLNFHRKEMVAKHGAFWVLRDPELKNAFNRDLLEFLETMEYRIISVVLDKKAAVLLFKKPWHPYHYGLEVLLEKYCEFLNYYNAHGDVMAESRGGKEDFQLKQAYRSLYEAGTWQKEKEFFQHALTSKEIKLKGKEANIAGLQIADLLAHPCKNEILFERGLIDGWDATFGIQIVKAAQSKYHRLEPEQPIEGYGKVFVG